MSKLGPYDLNTIVTGDARELAESIPDSSVDLIFTDPPYPKQFCDTFKILGDMGRLLKTNRRLLTLCGHYQLPEAMSHLEKYLKYDWIIANAAPGRTGAMFQKRVWATWKPCLVYRKGTIDNRSNFANDLFVADKESFTYAKLFHKWGQSASFFAYYIDRWTLPGDTILDPFCGGGTLCAVCKVLGRNYLAFEIDPATAARARERVAMTQPPLFVVQPEQAVMEFA